MICSYDIQYVDGEAYILLSDFIDNNFGYKKDERLFIMDLNECVDKRHNVKITNEYGQSTTGNYTDVEIEKFKKVGWRVDE